MTRQKPNLEHLMSLGRKTLGPAAPTASGPVSAPVAVQEPQAVVPAVEPPVAAPGVPVAPPVVAPAAIPASTAPAAIPEPAPGLPGAESVSGSTPAPAVGVTDFLAQAAETRRAKEAQQEAVETATCVFSVSMKKDIQAAADDAGQSVARWVLEAFEWCCANGITSSQVADAAAWVADDRNRKVETEEGMAPNRAKGSGVPIRASIYRKVLDMAKGVRPRLSNASVLEGCAVIRLHAAKK